jgi:hypothetical protein
MKSGEGGGFYEQIYEISKGILESYKYSKISANSHRNSQSKITPSNGTNQLQINQYYHYCIVT